MQILYEVIFRVSAPGRTVRYRIGTARLVVVVEKVRPRAPLLGDKTVSVIVVILRHTAGGLRFAKPAEEVGEIYGRAAHNGARKLGTCASPCEVVRPSVLIYGGKSGRAAVVLQACPVHLHEAVLPTGGGVVLESYGFRRAVLRVCDLRDVSRRIVGVSARSGGGPGDGQLSESVIAVHSRDLGRACAGGFHYR